MQFSQNQINEFWLQHERFLKTSLATETPNPTTVNLAELCQTNLASAFTLFKQIELNAITKLLQYAPDIKQLQQSIATTLANKNKIFLLGCGASGRLAMLLKRLWEIYHPNLQKQIICVAAGGDVSLIKSVEQFEDHANFGIKQLIAQGYTHNDLVIGLSASGESPFILAGVLHGKNTSRYKPYLIFNNPVSNLLARDSQHVLHLNSGADHKINVLSLDVGPMALTGSTRLQATSAMQIALGLALCSNDSDIVKQIKNIHTMIEKTPLEEFVPISQKEASILEQNEYVLYTTNEPILGLSLLADLTERSPTFNLTPFENIADINAATPTNNHNFATESTVAENNSAFNLYSPFYISIANTINSNEVWQKLLQQKPNCLNWPEFPETSKEYMTGFNLSAKSLRADGAYLTKPQHLESWQIDENFLHVNLDNVTCKIPLPTDLLQRTLLYKLYLNSHSTLMMGRLGYFTSNLMLSLKPSNFKLVDRAVRYSKFILSTKYNLNLEYKMIAEVVFKQIPKLNAKESIVNNVVTAILTQS